MAWSLLAADNGFDGLGNLTATNGVRRTIMSNVGRATPDE